VQQPLLLLAGTDAAGVPHAAMQYPELLAFFAKVEALDGVKAYRSSDRLLAAVNANGLG
jgi:hypothetical protein